ncbi:FAD-dependent monooxygenase [Portibacter marinus]|uniref:FAD-dependent monooxygenase n=1 Tax=Portibacter marinus TaxID=2898660 RepID=UPI001F274CE9|nr:FAD-dependent monooxygenase [Portibacter marinus]
MRNKDVIIIGAGPTGLMLANQFERLNVEYQIFDSKSGPTNQSRALAVSARSMELYQQLGFSDKVQSEAVDLLGFQIFKNGKIQANIGLQNIGVGMTDFPNFMNAYEQSKNEELLAGAIEETGKKILWNHSYIKHQEVDDGVEVQINDLESDSNQAWKAKYLVGCDGASSPVRKATDLKFEGGTYDNKFFVADTTIEWEFESNKVMLVPTDHIFITFFPLKGRKKMRIIGTLPVEFKDQEEIHFEELEAVIRKHTNLKFDIKSVGWHSTYRIHHRCVSSFRSGRIFLAGDSAHVHSPAGGQGMNTGLQDAHNLAWKLAMVLNGEAKPSLLDTYNEERLPFAKSLLNSTDKGFTFLAGDGLWVRNIRKYLLLPTIAKVFKIGAFRKFAFKRISQIGYGYRNSSLSTNHDVKGLSFKAGDRMPCVYPGFFQKLSKHRFQLLILQNESTEIDLPTEVVSAFPFEVNVIQEKITSEWMAQGVDKSICVLIRPDQYIMSVGREPNTLLKSFDQYFQ